ncbi:MAG: hypothetical protein IT429_24630 [Gemmataceae bacterium]|nr:hypothetical protein [Gemmataceae bacterium]
MLRSILRTGMVEAVLLLFGGLAAGAVGGFWGLFGGDGAASTAEDAARPYLALVVVLPALLALVNLSPPKLDHFATLARGLLVGLVAGGVGGLLAALGYFVPATNLPVILGGEDAGYLNEAVRSEVGFGAFLAVVLVSLVAGLAAGALTHYRVAAYRRAQRGG